VQRRSWQNLLLVHDYPPEIVARALPSDLNALRRAPREMLRRALSQLAWAHTKAVEPAPAGASTFPFLAGTACGVTYSSCFVCADRYLQVTLVEGLHETLHKGFVFV
jgi:hypothetical protein